MSEKRAGFLSSSLSSDEMGDFYRRLKRKEGNIKSSVQQLSDLDSYFTKIRRKPGNNVFFLNTFIALFFPREMTVYRLTRK